MSDEDGEITDLLPGLDRPLWQGVDDAFAAYVHDVFGTPTTLQHIRITATNRAGRSGVFLECPDGAIIFVLTPDRRTKTTHVRPVVVGPFCADPAIVRRAHESCGGFDNTQAITHLALRHLPVDVVRQLLAPTYH
jgi:hypothetical protein